MATTEYLKEMRGLIKSTLVATVGERRDPQLLDYLLDEAAVEIVAKGWVKTMPEFRKVLNEFIAERQPTKFGLAELKRLTRRCGVETGRYAALPFYDHYHPQPAWMTDAEAGQANRREWEAWSEKCEEIRRMIMNFGNSEMCQAFDEKEKTPWLPVDVLDPAPTNGQRFFYTPKEFASFTPETWSDLLSNLLQGGKYELDIVLSPDYQIVIDQIVVDAVPPGQSQAVATLSQGDSGQEEA
jgi:hypothetical protein